MLKKMMIALPLLAMLHGTAHAQFDKLLNDAKNALNQASGNNSGSGTSGLGSGLSNTDIVSGLKEALRVGTQNASGKLNQTNGYFGNPLVKILLPKEVQQAESMLRSFGFGSYADKLILSLNRAAEDAAKQATPIFVNAITSMSITDGLQILQGGNTAATDFLKGRTTSALTTAFRPVIDKSLSKVGANTYWSQFFTAYNKLPITKTKVNTDLSGYVTEQALTGMFTTIAQEESNIRKNPAGTANALLQKVFGSK